MDVDRILLPTDFSKTARRALSFAAHLADRHGATLHILHVRSPRDEGGEREDPETPTSQAELAECVRRAAEGLGDPTATGGHDLEMIRESVEAVSVQDAVVDYAAQHDVDLIVMGTARRSGIRTLFPQSTASAVVRHAPCPVMTVLDDRDIVPGPIDNIFVPFDFSEPATEAVRYAEGLAEIYGSTITLVHVVQELMVPMEYEVDVPAVERADVRARAETALRDVADNGHQALVTTGHPARRVVELASDRHADLIVIATHGRTGLQRVLLGSVAEQIIRRAPCPVVTVKATRLHSGANERNERATE